MTFRLQNGMEDNSGYLIAHGHEQPNRSEHKRMELQSNLETVLQEQHISRAARLQCRWLEVSERERQAHIYNRQLLQDFHKAQDTINNLMARTTAMNTLRVEYERHLEQLYPQWRQKLQEQRFSTQRKRLEMHLRECMTRIDDENPEVIPSNSASYSVPSSSQSHRRQEGPIQRPRNTHVAERSNKPKAPVNQNSSSPTGFSQLPYTWLTQVNQPIPRTEQMVTEPRGAHSSRGVPPPSFNLPQRGEVYNSYAPVQQDPLFVEDDRRENSPYPPSWAGVGEGLAPQAQPNPYGSWPPTGLPMLNPAVWRVMGTPVPSGEDVQSSQGVGEGGSGDGREDRGPKSFQPPRSPGRGPSPGWGHRMGVNNGTSDRTCELDTRPGADDESSAASRSSRRSKNKKKEGKGSQRSVMVEKDDTVSLQSSAVSQASLVPNFRHEVLSQNSIADSQSESAEQTLSISRRSKSTNGTPEQNKVQRENRSVNITSVKQSGIRGAIVSTKTQERPQEQTEDETEENEESLVPSVRSDIATGGEDDEDERLETDDEEEEEEQNNEGAIEERVENGEGAQGEQSEEEEDEDEDEEEEDEDEEVSSHSGQLKASREAASDKVLSDGSQKFRNGDLKKNSPKSSEKDKDKEADKSQSKDDPSEEEEEEDDDGDGDDDDDDDDEDQEEEEVDDDDDEDEKEEEEQHPKSAIRKEGSFSNRNDAVNLDDEDGEDDEELYNQEIEDDEDDEVVVDNGYARSEGPKYNFLKYLGEKDEDEDDIEGLLAPKAEVPKQKEMIPKVIVIQKGSESDSDEEVLQKKSSPMGPGNKEINSDDEFDHFYD